MNSSDLGDSCTLALAWLPSRLFTRDWIQETRPPEKDIGDAAIVLEVVSRIPAYQATAVSLLLQLWRQPATQDILGDAITGDSESRLRSLLAYSSFVRSGVVDTPLSTAVLKAVLDFSPKSTLDSLAHYYCHNSLPDLPTQANKSLPDPWDLAGSLIPFPIVPSIETAYSITHTFLYATDFGYSQKLVPESYSIHAADRMPRWMQHFMDLPDNDVVAELSVMASLLGMPSSLSWAKQLANRQSSEGALFASRIDDEGFHTTLVGLMAWSTALRMSNVDLETRLPQGRRIIVSDTITTEK